MICSKMETDIQKITPIRDSEVDIRNRISFDRDSKDNLMKTPLSSFSGACGDKVFWDFQPSTGKLTVSGIGEMLSYANYDYTPWSPLKSSIISIEIKEGITNIGADTLSHCSQLDTVIIADSVLTIESYALCENPKLVSITMGHSITSIKDSAFYHCTSLTSVTFPDSVVSIGKYCFSNCCMLESVFFGNGLETIKESAFSHCSGLTSIDFPSSLLSIGKWAFHYCSNLKKVTLKSASFNYLGEEAFTYTKLERFTYLSMEKVENNYRNQFDHTNLKSVSVPSNYEGTSFYGKPVERNGNLKAWKGGEIIVCIFDESSGIFHVSGSGSMWEYGSSDNFPWNSYRSTITKLEIDEGVTSIIQDAFKSFSQITSVVIPNSVKFIGKNAFEECTKLSEIILGHGVNTIEQNAFSNCTRLTVLNIPESISSIEDSAFSGCNNIHTVTYLGTSDPGKISSNVFESPYLVHINVGNNYIGDMFCGERIYKYSPEIELPSELKEESSNSSKSSNNQPSQQNLSLTWILICGGSLIVIIIIIVIIFKLTKKEKDEEKEKESEYQPDVKIGTNEELPTVSLNNPLLAQEQGSDDDDSDSLFDSCDDCIPDYNNSRSSDK